MSGRDFADNADKDDPKKVEKEEEAKLKAKYPSVPRPGPQLLQKRLQKGQKYFDSGDYNMAKAAIKENKLRLPVSTLSQQMQTTEEPCVLPPPPPTPPTGDTIPTPDCLPMRKTSIHVQSKLAASSP